MGSILPTCRRCGRVRPAPAEEVDYHGRPVSLRIKLPKRTRWPATDEHAKQVIVEKIRRGLAAVESAPGRDEKMRAAVELFHELIAQPLLLATNVNFRQVALTKKEEIGCEMRAEATDYDDDWLEAEYAWENMLAELPDHPLYVED